MPPTAAEKRTSREVRVGPYPDIEYSSLARLALKIRSWTRATAANGIMLAAWGVLDSSVCCLHTNAFAMPIANLQCERILFRLLAAWLLLALAATPQLAIATPLPRTVLIIDESDPSNGTPTTFSRTLRESLRSEQPHITVYGETLNLSQFSESRQEEILRSYVQEKYKDAGLGLVIAVGLSSLEFVNRWRPEFWPGIPVVFGAVDETSAAHLKLDGDTTGLTMRRSIQSMVAAARHLVPTLQGIAVLGGVLERDPYRLHFLSELSGFGTELKVTNMTGLPLAEQVKQAAALSSNTATHVSFHRQSWHKVLLFGLACRNCESSELANCGRRGSFNGHRRNRRLRSRQCRLRQAGGLARATRS
jgi:hypothetical protein